MQAYFSFCITSIPSGKDWALQEATFNFIKKFIIQYRRPTITDQIKCFYYKQVV